MRNIFKNNGIEIFKNEEKVFFDFCDFLLSENKKYNLTAIREKNAVFIKHFADSLKGAEYFKKDKKIMEIGSGGGFPSVPLKINNGDLNFTLVEATNKKCEFLKEVKKRENFKNFEVINSRCEQLAKNCDYRESFDIVTARAVASLEILLELCVPFLKTGGIGVFYKNYSEEELKNSQNALKTLNCKIKKIEKYTLKNENGEEDGGERCLIVVEKTEKTPEKYPREYKKILKSPL